MVDVGDGGDGDLVAAAVAGDRRAFETLLRRHYDRIHGIAWQLTGSRADADDIAQDVCCALAEKIGTFRGEAKFRTWLTGITFNACRDFRRRRRSLWGLSERLIVLAGLSPPPDGRGPACTQPPYTATRSRIPVSPCPAPSEAAAAPRPSSVIRSSSASSR